jgi:hypothetical protein
MAITARDLGWFFMAGGILPVVLWWMYQMRSSKMPAGNDLP